ncbi:YdcF family protein [Archangium violaceum]|uniref:ElyC/SanA/YdcF family protein n=1 Tax=Archangium violaceum TaxID=83451 RepID=UPI002B2BF595|nr:YdcF family protein [Archangium violaceum]
MNEPWTRAGIPIDTLALELNRIATFLARRDLEALTKAALRAQAGVEKVDLLLLLGNSLPRTAEWAAAAFASGIAERFMIAGGIGHSTPMLRETVRSNPLYSDLHLEGLSEAEIMAHISARAAGLEPRDILLETQSTNCGDNAVQSRNLVKRLGLSPRTVILMQDPTMQLRTHASFVQVWNTEAEGIQLLSHAPFVPQLVVRDGALAIEPGTEAGPLWSVERFVSLLLGEIPRLHDDEAGYGPRGKGFIAHVDVPEDILEAYRQLLPAFGAWVRKPG